VPNYGEVLRILERGMISVLLTNFSKLVEEASLLRTRYASRPTTTSQFSYNEYRKQEIGL